MPRYSPQLLISDRNKKIYDIPGLTASGMKAGIIFRLSLKDLIPIPLGSQLFMLEDRAPIGYERSAANFVSPGKGFGVAAFLPPGYTVTFNSAYREVKKTKALPLFAYSAVAFVNGKFYTAATRVDKELRQDERCMDKSEIKRGIKRLRAEFKENRLFRHLENCALVNNCPAAKNLFLNKYEAPLPTSPQCNANCLGCISYQPDKLVPITQPRIKFIPSPEEIAEVAIYHLERTRDPIVSFGQGCEGEPLLAGKVIERALRIIRSQTQKGMINLNTNASKTEILSRLFHAGLNSIRVSLNSCQEVFYNSYYQPRGYKFNDVKKSIKIAGDKNIFVSLNYLVMPGFTDTEKEFRALRELLSENNVDMIQWRNLNFDPLAYFRLLKFSPPAGSMLGIRKIIDAVKKDFPKVMTGYFNPSRLRISRFKSKPR